MLLFFFIFLLLLLFFYYYYYYYYHHHHKKYFYTLHKENGSSNFHWVSSKNVNEPVTFSCKKKIWIKIITNGQHILLMTTTSINSLGVTSVSHSVGFHVVSWILNVFNICHILKKTKTKSMMEIHWDAFAIFRQSVTLWHYVWQSVIVIGVIIISITSIIIIIIIIIIVIVVVVVVVVGIAIIITIIFIRD